MPPFADILPRPFYILRHGETEANAASRVAGFMDTPLTPQGREQAKSIGAAIRNLSNNFDIVVHSHLSRARETAVIACEGLGFPMQEISSIAERDFGDWTGMYLDDLRNLVAQGKNPPNGEKMDDFVARVVAAINEITALSSRPPLIVAHGGVFSAIGRRYGYRISGITNCCLYEFLPIALAKSDAFPWEIWHHSVSEDATPTRSKVEVTEKIRMF